QPPSDHTTLRLFVFPGPKPDLGGYSPITGHLLAGDGSREYRAPACRSGAAMVTADQCRTYSNEHKVLGIAADISIQRATAHMGISRSWTFAGERDETAGGRH